MLIKNLFRYWTYQVFAPGTVLREKYEAFRQLLAHDRDAHDHLAVLEEVYYNKKRVDFEAVVRTFESYSRSVSRMVDELLTMCPTGYWSLKDYHKKFDFYVRFMMAPPAFDFSPPFTAPLGGNTPDPVKEETAGGKAAVLDRLARELNLPVPNGFIITTRAFQYFIEANDLRPFINEKLADLDIQDPASLSGTAQEIEAAILKAPLPSEVADELQTALETLAQGSGFQTHEEIPTLGLAMRSSGVKEDGQASFAGQYLSLMNVSVQEAIQAYRQIIASKYSEAAMAYRIRCGIPDHETPMAVLVLEMLDAEAAGVIYTRDPEGIYSEDILIHSAWGLGGLVVDGRVTPDVIRMDRAGKVLEKEPGNKEQKMVLDREEGTRLVDLPPETCKSLSLGETDITTLHDWSLQLETFFNCPQDIEWCRSRTDGRLYLLQSRPLRQQTPLDPEDNTGSEAPGKKILCKGGKTICRGKAAGEVFVLKSLDQLKEMPDKAMVAAPYGLPQYVSALHKMAGIILQTGSTAGHFASIAREFGLPAMICAEGFDRLASGTLVTLDADAGQVVEGESDAILSQPLENRGDDAFSKSIFMDKLRFAIRFCADLRLTDPSSESFGPDYCRSLHDILRFVHETAMREMFFLGQRKGTRKKGARQLVSGLPLLFYVLDVGGKTEAGVTPGSEENNTLDLEDLSSIPLKAVFRGMSHPDICWDEATHFDWDAYDKIVMAGGIISPDSPQFGSYAVVARTYMNVNVRFGYHFVILDSMCTPSADENYILFRFSGGGGNEEGRWLRAGFIGRVLEELGFMTQITSDLIDARFMGKDEAETLRALDLTGRLLGATKLMDMYLKTEADVDNYAAQFMAGRYDFRTVKG